MGRLTAEPNIAHGNITVAKYSLAVDRRSKDKGADFIRCTAFSKSAEFAEKYLHKGTKIVVRGHIQTGSYEKDGRTIYTTDVIVDEQEFAESKNAGQNNAQPPAADPMAGFVNIPDGIDEELPFN